jgi:hypothetical protein
VVRKHQEQRYANKLSNLDEMNKLLQKHKLSKHYEEDIDNPSGTHHFSKWNL